MKKYLKLLIIGGLIFIGVTSCTAIEFINAAYPLLTKSPQEEEAIKAKAVKAAIDYFKKEKNLDVTITHADFSNELGTHSIYIRGYLSSDRNQEVFADVSWRKGYIVNVEE